MCCSFLSHEKVRSREALATSDNEIKVEPALRDLLPSTPEKEPILQLLRDAGILEIDQEILDSLPTWSEVT